VPAHDGLIVLSLDSVDLQEHVDFLSVRTFLRRPIIDGCAWRELAPIGAAALATEDEKALPDVDDSSVPRLRVVRGCTYFGTGSSL
jgi:hypothetical protein